MSNLDQALQELLFSTLQFIPRLIVGLLTFGLALLLAAPAGRAVKRALERRIDSQGLPALLARLTRWTVIIIGGVAALEQVNFNVTGFLAGLGVAGLTIGFALQDIARNFVAGVLLLLRKPFVANDYVNAGGFSGTVMDVNTRDTVIRADNGELVIIPNTKIFENPITNFSRSVNRQRVLTLTLRNSQNVDAEMDLLRNALQNVPGVLSEPQPTVWADRPGFTTVRVIARFWVNTQTSDLFAVNSAAVLALNQVTQT